MHKLRTLFVMAASAVWDGAVAQGNCGKAIRGTRRAGEVTTTFVLRRSSGWN